MQFHGALLCSAASDALHRAADGTDSPSTPTLQQSKDNVYPRRPHISGLGRIEGENGRAGVCMGGCIPLQGLDSWHEVTDAPGVRPRPALLSKLLPTLGQHVC